MTPSNTLYYEICLQRRKIKDMENRLGHVTMLMLETEKKALARMECEYDVKRVEDWRAMLCRRDTDGWNVDAVIPVNVLELLDK